MQRLIIIMTTLQILIFIMLSFTYSKIGEQVSTEKKLPDLPPNLELILDTGY